MRMCVWRCALCACHSDGERDELLQQHNSNGSANSRAARWAYDPVDNEVLDDRELYQHLLKEFVETGSAGAGNVFLVLTRI